MDEHVLDAAEQHVAHRAPDRLVHAGQVQGGPRGGVIPLQVRTLVGGVDAAASELRTRACSTP